MFARNTPRWPHPFGWIDLNGRSSSVKVTKISSHSLHSSLSASFAADLNRIYEATINNALPKSATLLREELTGENVQRMHLDVTRFASHYIASAVRARRWCILDQWFSAKTLTLMRILMRQIRLLGPAPFSLPLTAPHTPCYTLSHAQPSSQLCVRSANHTGCSDTVHHDVNAEDL